MRPARVYSSEGIVLKQIRLGEADKIVTLYTPAQGILRAVAKGVRRPSSRLAGHLEPFTHSHILVARGAHLDIITQAQTLHSFRLLRDELWRSTAASYVAEMVDRFGAEQLENRRLFTLLADTLAWLAEAAEPGLVLRFFEMALVEVTGYRPELRECADCRVVLPPEGVRFSAPAGGAICIGCARPEPGAVSLSLTALKVLRFLQRGDATQARRLRLEPWLQDEVEMVLRSYVCHLLERAPRSLAVLDALRRDELTPAAT